MSGKDLCSEELLQRAAEALRETAAPKEGLADALASASVALTEAEQAYADGSEGGWARRLWRLLMRHKGLTVPTAAAVLVGVVAVLLPQLTIPQVAFAEIMDKVGAVQTLHMKFTRGGRSGEAWLKRPNMVRVEYEDGTWEIHNGPTQWVIDGKANRATKRSSWYYRDAQRRGLDVVDMLIELPYTEGLSGFFSEKPAERVRREGRLLDLYKMDLEERGGELKFEALADARTHMLHSVKLEGIKDGETKTLFAFSVLEYDQPIADGKFTFEPKEGMTVVVRERKPEEPKPAAEAGSTLSGRIVWAATGRPVPEASVTLSAGDYVQDESGRSRQEFFTRAETDRDGRWEVSGVPPGRAMLSLRSWELDWPGMPAFADNVGTPKYPVIEVDGESEYTGLDFKVHKPEELFARITLRVTDEDGDPVEGAAAHLEGAVAPWRRRWFQSVFTGPGKHVTGPDGTLNARDVWPTGEPVRLHVSHHQEEGGRVTRTLLTESFVVDSTQTYHFDIVVPYERQIELRVVDPKGTPLQGVSVVAQAESGEQIFPRYGPEETRIFTDGDGRATIRRLMPREPVIVVLRRLRPGAQEITAPVATAWFPARAPQVREPSSLEVTFDERPIHIQGTIPVPAEPMLVKRVSCIVDRGPGRPELNLLLLRDVDDSGEFVLMGVPAGNVRLRYRLVAGEPGAKKATRVEGWNSENTIRTEPGNTYTVRIVGDRLEVTGVQPTRSEAVPERR